MKKLPADLRNIDFRKFVADKIGAKLSVWQGTEDIAKVLQLLKQCLEDKQFIRAVLKEAAQDFSYVYDVNEELKVDGVTVTVTEIQWEVDVDSDSLTQSVNFDGDVLDKILERDEREADELTEEENSQYVAEEKEITFKIEDAALEKWGNEYEISEVFEPAKNAFIKQFMLYAQQNKLDLKEEQIDALLEYGIDASKEPYDTSEYLGCIIKMGLAGIEHVHVKAVSKLIHGSFERIAQMVESELMALPAFNELEQEYLQKQNSHDSVRLNQVLLATAKIIREHVYGKVSLIRDDFQAKDYYQPVRYLDISDAKAVVVDRPAQEFKPEELVPVVDVGTIARSTGSYYKTIAFGTGAKTLRYPSKTPAKAKEMDIEPILVRLREEGGKVHEQLKAHVGQVQRSEHDKKHEDFRAAMAAIRTDLPTKLAELKRFADEHPLRVEYECLNNIKLTLSNGNQFWLGQIAVKANTIANPKKKAEIVELIVQTQEILQALESTKQRLLQALETKIAIGPEKIQAFAKKFKDAFDVFIHIWDIQKLVAETENDVDLKAAMAEELNLLRQFDELSTKQETLKKQAEEMQQKLPEFGAFSMLFIDLKTAIHKIDQEKGYWDFLEACKSLKDFDFVKKRPECKQITQLYEIVKTKPMSELVVEDTTNVIYPCFIFCIKTHDGKAFIPVSLKIDGAPYLISGDPEDVLPYSEDSIREQDKESALPADVTAAARAPLVIATRRMQVESAKRDDEIFIKTIGAEAEARYERETIESYIAQLPAGTDLGNEAKTGKLKIITGHSERVFSAALREPKVINQLIENFADQLKQIQERGELVLNSQTKVYSVSLLLYSDRSVCIHCTRTLIGQMRDWTDGSKPGFMRLLVDVLNSYAEGKGFVASFPDVEHDKVGLRSNCIVVTDRIYAKYDGDPQAHDLLHHKDATVVHADVIDIKLPGYAVYSTSYYM